MLKVFTITVLLLSNSSAAVEDSLGDNSKYPNKIIEHLDNQFPRPHVVSLSDVSAAIQAIYPNIDGVQAQQLQVDVVMVYLTRRES